MHNWNTTSSSNLIINGNDNVGHIRISYIDF
jgi:hypothetical protein